MNESTKESILSINLNEATLKNKKRNNKMVKTMIGLRDEIVMNSSDTLSTQLNYLGPAVQKFDTGDKIHV